MDATHNPTINAHAPPAFQWKFPMSTASATIERITPPRKMDTRPLDFLRLDTTPFWHPVTSRRRASGRVNPTVGAALHNIVGILPQHPLQLLCGQPAPKPRVLLGSRDERLKEGLVQAGVIS